MANSYDNFISTIRQSRPSNEKFDGSECHHVIPKCCGGSDDPSNLIYLTFSEHFKAHQLLVECNPDNKKLAYALWRMANGKFGCTPTDYEVARQVFINAGLDEEIKAKISAAHLGKSSGMSGKQHSEASKKKMSESAKRRISSGALGKRWTQSEEAKDKHRKFYHRMVYHINCKKCGNEFIANKPSFRYCENCRNRRD